MLKYEIALGTTLIIVALKMIEHEIATTKFVLGWAITNWARGGLAHKK
jgi:hypothetical protein